MLSSFTRMLNLFGSLLSCARPHRQHSIADVLEQSSSSRHLQSLKMSDNFGGYLPGPDSNDPLIPGILDRGHLPQEDLFENEPVSARL